MEKALARQRDTSRFDERSPAADAPREESIVDDFISKFMFFPPRVETAARILRLNEALSDSHIENDLAALPPAELDVPEGERQETIESGSWLSAIRERVSAILFHEDEPDTEQDALTGEEVVSLFQKTLSERIYNRLSMLSRSPHAKKGRCFSLREELTVGIAVNIGLGLYRYPETPYHLREEAKAALLDLAWEFQQWLRELGGVYDAPWGRVRLEGVEVPATEGTPAVEVLMVPDMQSRAGESGQAAWVAARRATSVASVVPGRLVASGRENG